MPKLIALLVITGLFVASLALAQDIKPQTKPAQSKVQTKAAQSKTQTSPTTTAKQQQPADKKSDERPDTVYILFQQGGLGGETARAADKVASRTAPDSEPLDPVADADARTVGRAYLGNKMPPLDFFVDGGVVIIYTKLGADGKLHKLGEADFIPPPPTAKKADERPDEVIVLYSADNPISELAARTAISAARRGGMEVTAAEIKDKNAWALGVKVLGEKMPTEAKFKAGAVVLLYMKAQGPNKELKLIGAPEFHNLLPVATPKELAKKK